MKTHLPDYKSDLSRIGYPARSIRYRQLKNHVGQTNAEGSGADRLFPIGK